MSTIINPTKSSTARLAIHIAAKLALELDLAPTEDVNGFNLVIEDIHDAILEALPMLDFVELQQIIYKGHEDDRQKNAKH